MTGEMATETAGRVFSTKWFEEFVEPLWKTHLLPRRKSIHKYLEIGVCEGRSFIWVIENLLTDRGDIAYAVDPFRPHRRGMDAVAEEHYANFRRNMQTVDRSKWEHFAVPSAVWLRRQDPGIVVPYDLIYVDGDHSGRGCMEDCVLAWALLAIGGIMIIDDTHRRYSHGRASVHEAALGFTEAYANLYQWIYREGRQWAIRRIR